MFQIAWFVLTTSFCFLGSETEESVLFLRTLQTSGGGYVAKKSAPDGSGLLPSLRTTRTALRAYRMLEGTPSNLSKIEEFVLACYDSKSGGFSDRPGIPPDTISTAVGLMALQELQLPMERYVEKGVRFMAENANGFEEVRMAAAGLEAVHQKVPQAINWLRDIDSKELADGSYGEGASKARSTSLFVVAKIRLGGEIKNRETLLAHLRKGQRADGGFGGDTDGSSDLESCYRIMRAFARLDASPNDVPKLLSFVASCRHSDGGYGVRPSEPSSVQGTYYATIVRQFVRNRQWEFEDSGLATEPRALPDGWRAGKALDGPGSEWSIREVAPHQHSLSQISSNGLKRQYNLCIAENVFKDVSISVNVRARTGTIDQGGGVIWRHQDDRNYYIGRWNPLEENFRLYKVVDGVRSQMDTAKVKISRSDWHSIRFVHMGRSIRGYLDDALLLEAEDDQFATPGRVGLWTKADAVTDFDSLHARTAEFGDLEELK